MSPLLSSRNVVVAFVFSLTGATTLPALAQTPDALTAVQAPAPTRRPQTLQEVANEIVWNPAQQGALVIVAPSETYVPLSVSTPQAQPDGTYRFAPGLPARSADGLRLEQLTAYFDRQVISCGDVTVFAPATMMVLNDKGLPRPSAFAGLTPADSFPLLQASLSDSQWRQLASAQGLGLADLTDDKQRILFLAAVSPRPSVTRFDGTRSETLPLTEVQRRGIRLRLVQKASWWTQRENGTGIGIQESEWSATNPSLSVGISQEAPAAHPYRLFGVDLASIVPAHAKPGDLPFRWQALDPSVSLADIHTLGDLVDRIRQRTGVPVYADPRYARLPLLLRGEQARAGNLLNALAHGVTGTYRKVGGTYLLTDDLNGLATRHARIQQWIDANYRLAAQVDQQIAQAFARVQPERFVTFAADDPTLPSDRLRQQEAAYQAARHDGTVPNSPQSSVVFSIADLPLAVQRWLRKRDEQNEKYLAKTGTSQGTPPSIGVSFTLAPHLTWSIPGVGNVEAPYQVVPQSSAPAPTVVSPPAQAQARPVPQNKNTRAVIVRRETPPLFDATIRAAKRAGCNELWLEADPTDKETPTFLAQAVQKALGQGLAVRAVVRAGRRKPAKEVDRTGIDVNVLGETYSQFLARVLAEVDAPDAMTQTGTVIVPTQARSNEAEARVQKERGDWLDPDAPTWEENCRFAVAALAKIPGLAGIVLSDLTPPGYQAPVTPGQYASADLEQPGARGGYSEARRADFIRRFHVDPIDYTLIGTARLASKSLRFRQMNRQQLILPFFPDTTPVYVPPDDTAKRDVRDKSALEEWNRFWGAVVESSLARLQQTFASAPLPIWFYRNTPDARWRSEVPFRVESRDKIPPANAGTLPTENTAAPRAVDRAHSRTLLLARDIAVAGSRYRRMSEQDGFVRATAALFDPQNPALAGWDGFVLDLTGETDSPDVLLALLPPPPAS